MKKSTAYGNRNTKMRLDRIAEKYNVDMQVVLSYAQSKYMKVYNLPPKGSKKDRLFISKNDGLKIKKHFELQLKKMNNPRQQILHKYSGEN